MANNYFITGLPKSGKTMLLRELVKRLKERGVNVGGLLSSADQKHGTRNRYIVTDISTGESAVLASVDGDGPKVSKYHLNLPAFEELTVPTMRYATNYDVFVLDEIGPMEMRSTKFTDLLANILTHDVPLVASLNESYINDYKGWGRVILLTSAERERVLGLLLELVGTPKRWNPGIKARKTQKKAGEGKKEKKKKSMPASNKKTEGRRRPAGKKGRGSRSGTPKKGPVHRKGIIGRIKNILGL